jgi:hypothetical protein
MGVEGFSWVALGVAALAATGYAVSASLQHVAARETDASRKRAHVFLAQLTRRPWWLAGQVIAFAAFGLHALALHLGALLLVQPVVVSGVVLAVPIRASLARRVPSAHELGTVVMTVAGLCLFLAVARPAVGRVPATQWRTAVTTSAGVLVAVLAAGCAGRCRRGPRAASLFGIASGVLFGLVAGLLKLTVSLPGLTEVLTSWTTWAALVIGAAGVATTQRGYRVARMSACMPVLTVTDVVVAVVFGVVVFGEVPAHGPAPVLGELVAGLMVLVGLWRLGMDDVSARGSASAGASPGADPPLDEGGRRQHARESTAQ